MIAAPLWWGGLPAVTKGLFDRILLPGRAFDTRQMRLGLPRPMLKGRSARLILTSHTPRWYMRLG
ncbi:MAG: NAD(P)H-dependent oxidoreductase [Shimia sp.]